MHHQGRLIGHEKRVDFAQLRHIQDKPPSHHTGQSELTKTFDGMGPHSGDTISVPSNRRMVLKIQGFGVQTLPPLKKKNTKQKKLLFSGKMPSLHMLPWCLPIFIQVSHSLFPPLPQTAFKDNIMVFLILTEIFCRQQKAVRRNKFKYGFLSLNLAYFTKSISFNLCYRSPRPTSNFSGLNLSPPQRRLCVVGMAGEKKKSKRAGHDRKVKERKRGLRHITCASLEDLRLCGFR